MARSKALQAIFQVDVGRVDPGRALAAVLEGAQLSLEDREFAASMVHGTLECLPEVDALISRFALGWTVDRLANVDRNVLRLAVHELLYREDIPPGVCINEAVELAKTFGGKDSGGFVNGILENIRRELAGELKK